MFNTIYLLSIDYKYEKLKLESLYKTFLFKEAK